MKRLFAILLALTIFCLSGCGTVQTVQVNTDVFTDSLGRAVKVPAEIRHIAATGLTAQLTLFALCPDCLVGLADPWSDTAAQYLDDAYLNLPALGQLYGGKGDLNPETLLQSGAEVMVDIGEAKDGMAAELDALQAKTGIPCIHIDASLATMGSAYRMLGELLHLQADAEILASYCENTYATACTLASRVEKVRALYVTGDAGQNVLAKNAYHSEAFDLMCDNLAVVENPAAKGTGNEVGLEQILLWDPDYIVFAPGSIYAEVGDDPAWQTLPAVAAGNYCEVPDAPYPWLGFPPGAQRLLGMLWLGKVLYGDAAEYDLYTETAEFYRLFYHCELTRAQFDALTAHSNL